MNTNAMQSLKAALAGLFLCMVAIAAFAQSNAITEALEEAVEIQASDGGARAAYDYLGGLGELGEETEIMFSRAWYAGQANLLDEAEKIYRELMARDPEDALSYYGLGRLLAENKYVRLYEALDLLEKAREVSTYERPEFYAAYGYALKELGHLSAAEEYYEDAVQLLGDEVDTEIFLEFGDLLLETGQEERAQRLFDYIEESNPDNPFIAFVIPLREMFYKKEVPIGGVESFLEEAQEFFEEPYLSLLHASALQLEGNDEEAKKVLEQAGVDENSSLDHLDLYASLMYKVGEAAEAERIYRFLINQEPDNPWHYNSLGFLLAEEGRDLDEAAETLEKALELAPDRPEILDSYGWVLYRQGRFAAALAMVERSFETEQEMRPYSYIEGLAHYGEILWEMGDREAAVEIWHDAWYRDSEHDKLLDTLQRYGQEYEEVGDKQSGYIASILRHANYLYKEVGARWAYEYLSSLDLLFNSEDLLRSQAYYAVQAEDWVAAEDLYRTLIKNDPENPVYQHYLGYLLVEYTERVVEGGLFLQEALELAPDDPEILASLGWAMYRQGRLNEAQSTIGRAVRMMELDWENNNKQAEINAKAHYGEVLWELGHYSDAVDVWQDAWLLDDYDESGLLFRTMSRYSKEHRSW